MSFSIIGTGSAAPLRVITNEDLTKIVDTNPEWIETRTGIRERRICTTESISDLAFKASETALKDARIKPEELDLIICATVTGEYITPSMGCVIQERLGATCPAFDINAACTGFIYALDVAAGYFARNPNMKILVVAAEAISRIVDWTDRGTCVIFADGAGAVVLGHGEDLLAIKLSAKGNCEALVAANVMSNNPFNEIEARPTSLKMNGKEVFKFAVNAMSNDIKEVINTAKLTEEDVDYVLPHQANLRIIEAARNRLNIPKEKYLINIERYGNTSAAAIPLLMDEARREGKFKKGNILALSSFGGGLTTGACVIRWNL